MIAMFVPHSFNSTIISYECCFEYDAVIDAQVARLKQTVQTQTLKLLTRTLRRVQEQTDLWWVVQEWRENLEIMGRWDPRSLAPRAPGIEPPTEGEQFTQPVFEGEEGYDHDGTMGERQQSGCSWWGLETLFGFVGGGTVQSCAVTCRDTPRQHDAAVVVASTPRVDVTPRGEGMMTLPPREGRGRVENSLSAGHVAPLTRAFGLASIQEGH